MDVTVLDLPPAAERAGQRSRTRPWTPLAEALAVRWQLLPLLLFAAVTGYLAVTDLRLAVVCAAVPVGLLLLVKPQWAAVLVVVSLPFLPDLAGSETGSVN